MGTTLQDAGLRIGTAGWTVPRAVAHAFPSEGSGLQRYAARLNAAEINVTFYRRPRPATLERWAEEAPPGFRFAFKVPRAVTHEARLDAPPEALAALVEDARRLGDKLGPLLVQLPPSLAFDPAVAGSFFARFRDRFEGQVACEPRHVSWFEAEAEALLAAHQVARVAADPARHPLAGRPGGWDGFAYWRWHGSPRVYFSSYDDGRLDALADTLRTQAAECWVILDNTASGTAAADALRLQGLVGGSRAGIDSDPRSRPSFG